MKIDSISLAEQEKFAHFSLLGVQFLIHHHWLEETIICVSSLTSYLLQMGSLEPKFTCPAVEEHATFSEAIHNLEHYLEDICGFEKKEKDHAIAAQGKQKGRLRRCKDQRSNRQALRTHVHSRERTHAIPQPRTLEIDITSQLKAEMGYLDPAKVRATGPPVEKLEQMNAAIENHLQNEVEPFGYLVHGCLHVPPTTAQFPPIPRIVRKLLVPWVFYWKHRSIWKYVPNYTAG